MALGTLIPSMPSVAASASQAQQIFNSAKTLSGRDPVTPMWSQAFLFDYAGEATYSGSCEITTHVVEDATYISDHVTVRPIEITLSGYTGIVALSRAQVSAGILGAIQNLVGSIPAYAGKYTPGAAATISSAISQTQTIATQLGSAYAQAQSIGKTWGLIKGLSRPQQAFARLQQYRDAGQPFRLLLPFSQKAFENMVIKSLKVTEPEETTTAFNFTVILQQVRYVEEISAASWPLSEPASKAQRAKLKYVGFAKGQTSTLSSVMSGFGI